MSSIGTRMAKGAAWMVASRLLDRGIGVISIAVLGRLLLPGDFGLVAMATAAIAVVQLLTAFSFDLAIIQKADAGREYYDTAWTLGIGFAVVISVTLLLISKPAAWFYGDPRVSPILACLALATFIQGLQNPGTLAFRKELELHKEFWFQLAKKIAGLVVTLTAAFILRSYWALVIGAVTSAGIGVIVSYLAHPYRPRFSLKARRHLFGFSKWLFLNNTLITLYQRSGDFVIGRICGSQGLGLYSVAFELSNLPTSELAAPINRAVFPGYAKLASDVPALRASFLTVLGLTAIITVPAAAGIIAVAKPLVLTLLGPNWSATIPLISVLALYGLGMSIQTNIGYVFIALGQPMLITKWAAVQLAITLSLLILGARLAGPLGAAYAMLGSVVLLAPALHWWLFKLIRLTLRGYLGVVSRPLVGSLTMFVALRTARFGMEAALPAMPALFELAILVILGIVVYGCAVLLLWSRSGYPSGAESQVLTTLRGKLQRWGLAT